MWAWAIQLHCTQLSATVTISQGLSIFHSEDSHVIIIIFLGLIIWLLVVKIIVKTSVFLLFSSFSFNGIFVKRKKRHIPIYLLNHFSNPCILIYIVYSLEFVHLKNIYIFGVCLFF